MKNLPVHWHEGMFLRPHQFQASDRYWSELVDTSGEFDRPYRYGLRSIEISEDAIRNHHFQVTAVRARTMDGTIIDLPSGQEPDRIDLREAFGTESVVRVFLAVPRLKLGQANVGREGSVASQRYIETDQNLQDESAGGGDQDLSLRRLRVCLLHSSQDLAGYEVLPIAQIQRAGDEDASPSLDREYIPPLLAIEAWPGLAIDIIRSIYDIIGNRISALSEYAISRGVSLASATPGDLNMLLMLRTLNEAYASLGCLAFAQGVHPFCAYQELCRVVGMLSVFGPARRVEDIPHYDHDELARIFRWIKLRISDLIDAVEPAQYVQRYFKGAGKGMQVTLEGKWFDPGWSWFVGVQSSNISADQCRDLLSEGRGKLNWKMGSSGQVEDIFVYKKEGVRLELLEQAPRAVPIGGGWTFYQVGRKSAYFDDVQNTQTLAIRFTETLIGNMESLQGERTLLVNYGGAMAELQFALFAIPNS